MPLSSFNQLARRGKKGERERRGKPAEEHMDFIPETTGNLLQNIDAWLKYWKTDLMPPQNYCRNGVEAKKAKEQMTSFKVP